MVEGRSGVVVVDIFCSVYSMASWKWPYASVIVCRRCAVRGMRCVDGSSWCLWLYSACSRSVWLAVCIACFMDEAWAMRWGSVCWRVMAR